MWSSQKTRAKWICLGLLAVCALPWVVTRIFALRLFFIIDSVQRWPVTYAPLPENKTEARYAIATILSWKKHELAAMTLCYSVKRATLPSDIELVVLAAERDGDEPPDADVLRRCFDRVIQHSSILPRVSERPTTGLNAAGSLNVLWLFTLTEYRRIVFLETDVVAVRPTELFDLVRTPLTFAAVQSTPDDDMWQGGVAAFEPDPTVYDDYVRLVWTRLRTNPNFDSEHLFQERFAPDGPGVLVLPPKFDVEPRYSEHDVYVPNAVALHFSLRKPWNSVCDGAYDYWHELASKTIVLYRLDDSDSTPQEFSAEIKDWFMGWVIPCGVAPGGDASGAAGANVSSTRTGLPETRRTAKP